MLNFRTPGSIKISLYVIVWNSYKLVLCLSMPHYQLSICSKIEVCFVFHMILQHCRNTFYSWYILGLAYIYHSGHKGIFHVQDHVPDYHLCFMSRAIIGHARSKPDRCYVSQFPPFGFGAFMHTCVYIYVCSELGLDHNELVRYVF